VLRRRDCRRGRRRIVVDVFARRWQLFNATARPATVVYRQKSIGVALATAVRKLTAVAARHVVEKARLGRAAGSSVGRLTANI